MEKQKYNKEEEARASRAVIEREIRLRLERKKGAKKECEKRMKKSTAGMLD